ncbi:hypothetical protein [Sphingomonas humi]|uniref:Calcium-binding protein n=1 Tax=Sphingomonas humi TaxID=335630 RepID=A0ABP7RI52_9SPHN
MARLVLTEPGEDVDVGGNVTVIGTTAPDEVITILRGNIVLDPSFNAGGDTVRLPDIASSFTIRLSGATATIVGLTSSVTIPVGSAGLTVAFDDVARTLKFDTTLGFVTLGDQRVTSSETGVLPFGATGQLLGTEGADTVNGTESRDVIDGLGGNDTINGLGGDDFIRGGAGNDTINGGAGNDEIYGGSGDDRIIDDIGDFGLIYGGLGNDNISVNNPTGTSFTISGGDGDDEIVVNLGPIGVAYINAGAGADKVASVTEGADVIVTLGAGRDQLIIPAGALADDLGVTVVQDFTVGATGDIVVLKDALTAGLTNWDPGTNPFATGHLQLVNIFGNTYLQVDRDGPGGPLKAQDLIGFAGVAPSGFTAENFNGYDPKAAPGAALASSAQVGDSQSNPLAVGPDLVGDTGLVRMELHDTLGLHTAYYFFA